MNPEPEDCSRRSRIGIVALIGVLAAVAFIPPQRIGGVQLRRANILSDILRFNDGAASENAAAEPELFDEEEFSVDLEAVAESIVADTAPRQIPVTYEWRTDPGAPARREPLPDTLQLPERGCVPIEDFSAGGAMRGFYDTLLEARRPVRIAFLGDSFVEGDILTADLRERLQTTYGGGGAGFAPMASPLAGFRRTIRTQSKGWTAYNIMQRKTAPEPLRANFYVSGWICRPSEGASTRWERTDYRERLGDCTSARLLFISSSDSRLEVVLNDTLRREFAVGGDAAVRQIVVTAPRIGALELRVAEGADGFAGYGAVFDGEGVCVDNYSVRSNNGQAMFWTNPSVDAQIDALLGYDLVVLQYGLNIMQQGVHRYDHYAAQIEKMIAFVRECFPRAAVLVLGVSDRSVKGEEGFAAMDAIPDMLRSQREAARRAGAAFWSTCDAMRALGGMETFVRNGWAGKDFTHINYAGGRRVAWALADAVDAGVRERLLERRRREEQRAVLDSLQRERVRRELLPDLPAPKYNLPEP